MVNVEGFLYFSPSTKFDKFKSGHLDPDVIIDSFIDRTKGFFLDQARVLLDKSPFGSIAGGVILMSTIDYLARYNYLISFSKKGKVGERIERWLKEYIPDLKEPEKFYQYFRNGLVHEGRIKGGGAFEIKDNILSKRFDDTLIINPIRLLEEVEKGLTRFCKELKLNHEKKMKFIKVLKDDFQQDHNIGIYVSKRNL